MINLPTKDELRKRLEKKCKIKDQHWLWAGYINKVSGQGQIGIGHNVFLVTRVAAYVYQNFDFLNDNRLILHKCRYKHCFSPYCTYPGNTSDNNNDAVRDGTYRNQNTGKMICNNGHALSNDNIYQHTDRDGTKHRRCRLCRAEASRCYLLRKKG